ncbi:hypothetical protein HPB48_006255 [Haemaphysalis longicornis]|uniref:PiggyBac transposable element-derived protein domain-containing protein n=1 Tax=Haemaphysalis longicornis TaxID=44386 RepID=A0A9J6GT83_HAELO|nr:hypothetical protein HPB48_006255 [Haemaphysalis longicornis]
MTRDRFTQTASQTENRLFRVEPIIDAFRKACLELPRPEVLSVDEQMIPFSGRCPARQYVPSKPNPVGLKNFVLSSSDGLVLDFLIYTGKGTVPDADMKELGLGGAVVKRLLETVPTDEPVHVFTDRFFYGNKVGRIPSQTKCISYRHNCGKPNWRRGFQASKRKQHDPRRIVFRCPQ